jgi:hypothetical protein
MNAPDLCPRLSAWGAILAIAAAAPPARADDSAAAQALFDQAKKGMAAHDYTAACPKLEESLKLQEAVGTLLNLADCYEHQGKLASAWSKYLDVATKARAAGQTQRARIARDRATALATRLSQVVVEVPAESRVEGLEVRRDGTVVGEAEWGVQIPADAGPHTISASAPGRKPWSLTVDLPDGAATSRATVPPLQPLPPPAEAKGPDAATATPTERPAKATVERGSGASAQRVAGVVVAVVGAVGVGVGGAFGILSILKHTTVSQECGPKYCPSNEGTDASRDAITYGNVSTVAFIAGGVGLAAGLTLWWTAPGSAEGREPAAQLVVGPNNMAIRGTW